MENNRPAAPPTNSGIGPKVESPKGMLSGNIKRTGGKHNCQENTLYWQNTKCESRNSASEQKNKLYYRSFHASNRLKVQKYCDPMQRPSKTKILCGEHKKVMVRQKWQLSSLKLLMVILLWFNCVVCSSLASRSTPFTPHAEDKEHWYQDAQDHLQDILEARLNSIKRPAKNVILFIGDGMGLSTITAGRILKGQKKGYTGEEYKLSFEKFPHIALAKTYTTDSQIGDSTGCATALMCGVKANVNTLGLDNSAKFEDCLQSFNAKVPSLIDWAQKHGKSTGIVTNTRLTHGTPSALYAHSASRYWEDDSRMSEQSKACKDIAKQLVEDEPGKNINVLLGGGRRHFLPHTEYDREERDQKGRRTDGRHLLDEWVQDKKHKRLHAEYVWNKGQFDKIDPKSTDYLLGVFGYSHLDFEIDRNKDSSGDPSLIEMTVKAIQILQKNPKGFFLMVEGGRIDHAHHHNNARRALDEVGSLDDTIIAALQQTSITDTLMVVTADHSHVMTFGGDNTPRGNPITGFDTSLSDMDHKPYTTLLYGNGPGYSHATPSGRHNISAINPEDLNFVQQSAVPRKYETHSGEDVPVYAIGPGSYLFSGTVEQSYIPHAIGYATCMSPDSSHCEKPPSDDASATKGHQVPHSSFPYRGGGGYPNVAPNSYHPNLQHMNEPASAPVEERKYDPYSIYGRNPYRDPNSGRTNGFNREFDYSSKSHVWCLQYSVWVVCISTQLLFFLRAF